MPRQSLMPRLARGKCLIAPGVFDLISTHMLNQHGAEATYMTGFGVVASALGLPDAGLATYTEMLDRAQRIAEFSRAPVIADADTGYGGLLACQASRPRPLCPCSVVETRVRPMA